MPRALPAAYPGVATHPPAIRWSRVLCCGMARRSAPPPGPGATATPRAAAGPTHRPGALAPGRPEEAPGRPREEGTGGTGRRKAGGLCGEAARQSYRSGPHCPRAASAVPPQGDGASPGAFSGLNAGPAPTGAD